MAQESEPRSNRRRLCTRGSRSPNPKRKSVLPSIGHARKHKRNNRTNGTNRANRANRTEQLGLHHDIPLPNSLSIHPPPRLRVSVLSLPIMGSTPVLVLNRLPPAALPSTRVQKPSLVACSKSLNSCKLKSALRRLVMRSKPTVTASQPPSIGLVNLSG